MSNLLGPSVGYTDLLDKALLAKQEEEQKGPRKFMPLRPSSAGQCGRSLAFQYNEYEGNAKYDQEVRTPAIIRLLNFGHSVEWHFLKQLESVPNLQIKYKQQVVTFFKLSHDVMIEGSLDMVVYSEETRGIGDVKSKGDKYSTWTATKWNEDTEKLRSMKSVRPISDTAFWVEDLPAFLDELTDPFLADNFYQLNGYACTDFIKERGIDHGFILQYNKNDSRIREIRFKPSMEVFERVREKFQNVITAVKEHKDPMLVPRDFQLGSMRCAFCPFNRECWGEAANAKQEYFDTFPNKRWPKDTNRMPAEVGARLEELYSDFQHANEAASEREAIEAELCDILNEANVNKVRFANGDIYEMKLLKNPRPHFELRRSKL